MSRVAPCPYCNSTVPLGDLAAGDRATCPRCDQAFAVRADAVREVEDPETTLTDQTVAADPSRRWAVRLGVLVALLAVGGGVAAFVLSGPDDVVTEPSELRTLTDQPAASWHVWRHLPRDTDAVLAVRPDEVLKLLPAERRQQIPEIIGVPADTLVEAAVGLKLGDSLDVTIVLIGERRFRPNLTEAVERDAKRLFPVPIPAIGVKLPKNVGLWGWLPDAQTAVLRPTPNDFDDIPDTPNAAKPPPALADLLDYGADVPAWFAAAGDKWADSLVARLAVGRLAAGVKLEDLQSLRRLRASLSPGVDPSATLDIALDNPLKTAALAVKLKSRLPEAVEAVGAGEYCRVRVPASLSEVERAGRALAGEKP